MSPLRASIFLILSSFISINNGGPISPHQRFLGLRHDMHQGDMKLTEGQLKNGVVGDTYRWPGGVVVYTFDSSFTKDEKKEIRKGMKEISDKTCVTFRKKGGLLGILDKDYVYIKRGAADSGCWANVGRIGGKQTVNLEAPGCISAVGPVPHELMHAIGFQHEFVRPDRDDYVRILWDNIDPKQKSNYYVIGGNSTTDYGFGYDYVSIMQYPRSAFSINGSDTIQPIPDNDVPFGTYDHLSDDDAQKVNLMYKDYC